MLASTPTTQPIAGTAAAIPGVPAPAAAPAPVASAAADTIAGDAYEEGQKHAWYYFITSRSRMSLDVEVIYFQQMEAHHSATVY